MLPVPPFDIVDLIDVVDGGFVLDDSATDDQRAEFEAFVAECERMKAETMKEVRE